MQGRPNLDQGKPLYMYSDNQLQVLLNNLDPKSPKAWEVQQELTHRQNVRGSESNDD